MGRVTLNNNPLDSEQSETCEHSGPLIDFIVQRFPGGFNGRAILTLNDRHLAIEDSDIVIGDGDEVYILISPQGPAIVAGVSAVGQAIAAGGGIGAILATAAIGTATNMALSYVVSWLRGEPEAPESGARDTPSPTYTLSSPRNTIRLGQTMPVVYGRIRVVPDIISQPYTWFDLDDENTQDQYIWLTLAIGRGDHFIHNVYVGDTNVTTLPAGSFLWEDAKASEHNNDFYYLQSNTPTMPRYRADVETSPEVGDQVFEGPITHGPYSAVRVGGFASTVVCNFEFRNGLFESDVNGNPTGARVDFILYASGINDDDTPNGLTFQTGFFKTSAVRGIVRWSRAFVLTGAANACRWRVLVQRTTPKATTATKQDSCVWTGLTATLAPDPVNGSPEYDDCYEDMHIMAVQIKATAGVSRDAASRISVDVSRQLEGAATSNPAQIAKDAYTNATYGAGRPLTELDTAQFDALQTKWAGIDGFHAVYDRQSTVWATMQQALRIGDSAPTIYGGEVTIAEDVNTAYDFLFSESNIVDKSMTISYQFNDNTDFDCIEVEYLEPPSYIPMYVRYPVAGTAPRSVQYFGCCDKALAEHQAEFLWFKRTFRRKRISFQTEAVGNLPIVGQRITCRYHNVLTPDNSYEKYIVESIQPSGEFSATIEALYDPFIYSPIPGVT